MIAYLTITRNNPEELLATARSVPAHDSVRWYVADGGSEGFDVFLRESLQPLRRVHGHVSVSDRGIYEAMNNALACFRADAETGGLDRARTYVNFINSGDVVHPDFRVADFLAFAAEQDYPDLIAGHSERVLNGHAWIWRPKRSLQAISWGMPFEHQAVFVRADRMQAHGFDTHYRIAGDYDFLSRVVRDADDPRYVIYPHAVCRFGVGGVSFSDRATAILEQAMVYVRVHRQPFPWVILKIIYQYVLHTVKKTWFRLRGRRTT